MAQSPPPHQYQQQQQQYYPPTMYQAPQPTQHGYPQPPQPAPAFHVSSKGMWSSKLSLRLLSMVFCIVIVSLAGVVLSDLAQAYNLYGSVWDDYYYLGYPGPILFLGPPTGVAFVWSLVESICICARGGHRGIHPGACVAIDLLLWLGFVGGAVCVGLFLPWIFTVSSVYTYPMTTFVFGLLQAAVHFALFVIACCETSARNRQLPVTYVPNAPYGNTTLSPSNGPPVAVPYQTKEQVTPVVQTEVARKPMSTSSFGGPRSPTWDQHNGPSLEYSALPSEAPNSSDLPTVYQPNGRY